MSPIVVKLAPEPGAAKATIQRILDAHPIRPHKMAYYLGKRDPEFDRKMEDILCVYKEVDLQSAAGEVPPTITVSVDEKPGVQAIKHIAPDIMLEPGKHSTVTRDYRNFSITAGRHKSLPDSR